MNPEQKIQPEDLINMGALTQSGSVRIELAYSHKNNLLFGEQIYRPEARLWLHRSLAEIVIQAADLAQKAGHRLVLFDGLRTTTAQAKMLQTQRVKDNPHWLEEPRLLSPPGKGAHPRGMAIDASLETKDGALLDMGTAFDYLAADPSPAHNPAHRAYTKLLPNIKKNRDTLDGFMTTAAELCQTPLFLLPQEWWDFRLPPEIYEAYAPLSDYDLPPHMRLL